MKIYTFHNSTANVVTLGFTYSDGIIPENGLISQTLNPGATWSFGIDPVYNATYEIDVMITGGVITNAPGVFAMGNGPLARPAGTYNITPIAPGNIASGSYYSVQGTLKNNTPLTLKFHDVTMVHGTCNASHFPDAIILPGGSTTWLAESFTNVVGVEGTMGYQADGVVGLFALHFDIPFIGGNTFDNAPSPVSAYKWVVAGNQGGNHVVITYTLKP